MIYHSTRNEQLTASSTHAVLQGIAPDGGLYICDPAALRFDWRAALEKDTLSMAADILHALLPDFQDMDRLVRDSYAGKFPTSDLTPLTPVADKYVLELYHGPTSAFKDVALSVLPRLIVAAAKAEGMKGDVVILTATSGDTGKAAMEGFHDVPGTRITVFYPYGGVSAVQQAQMATQEGANVRVCAVRGNFDDAQTGVKTLFSDERLRDDLAKRGYFLSSANSINWGRILPQVVYYISAYCDLVRDGALTMGDKVNFCVPTGNFGDILAAYYAKRMGLPVNRLICASNSNNVLTDFLRTGIYDRNRPFHTTISPSMDILISSNLERLLFDLSGENDAEIRMYMDALGSAGRYQVSDNIKAKLDDAFWGGCCSEEETEETIRRYWQDHNYLIDPHTAVAAEVLAQYRIASGDETPAVEVSTASPYKFCGSVLTAIGETPCGDGLELLDQLHAVSGVPVPCRLAELKGKPRRFDKTVEKQAMEQAVLDFLK